LCPASPNLTHECVQNVLNLSCNVNECKPLIRGNLKDVIVIIVGYRSFGGRGVLGVYKACTRGVLGV